MFNKLKQVFASPEPKIDPSYLVVLVEGTIVSEESVRATTLQAFRDITGMSSRQIKKHSQVQVIRESETEIQRMRDGGEVGVVVATELAIMLGNKDLPKLFANGSLKSAETLTHDPGRDLSYGVVVLYSDTAGGSTYPVKFNKVRIDKSLGVESTYIHYTAKNKQIARRWLASHPVKKRLFFVAVDTPEGGIAKDVNGMYEQ